MKALNIIKLFEEEKHFSKQELFNLAKKGDETILGDPNVDKYTNKFNESPIDILANVLGVNPFTLLDKIHTKKVAPTFSKPKVELD